MSVRREAKISSIYPRQFAITPRYLSQGQTPKKQVSLSMVIGSLRLADAVCVLAPGIGILFAVTPDAAILPLAIAIVALATVLTMNILHLVGAYRGKTVPALPSSIAISLVSWGVGLSLSAALMLLLRTHPVSLRVWLEGWALGGALALVLSRCCLALLARHWRRTGRLHRTAAIFGAGPLGQRLIQKLTAASGGETEIIGLYDDRIARLPKLCLGHPIRGTLKDLIRDIRSGAIDCVFVALPLAADWRLTEIMNQLSLVPVDVKLCADSFGFQVGECEVTHIGGLTVLDVCSNPAEGFRYLGKLIEDKVLAALILALVAPLMAVVAVLIKLDSTGPVFFRQKRHGWNNELIEVLKFRSLYHEARDQNAEKLCTDGDPRVTRIGAFLRKSMIDELPQFINVLRGEMSIVGPRPHALAAKAGGLLYREAVKYYDARHRMKPGITGWAQVNGWRGETRTVEEIHQRVAHDLYYINNWSVLLDLKIILWTVLGALTSLRRKKPRNLKDHAVSLANVGRSRSAA